MKILKYTELLIKLEILKHEERKCLRKLEILKNENEILRTCLENEQKRTKAFRNSYRKKLNEYEELESKIRNGK